MARCISCKAEGQDGARVLDARSEIIAESVVGFRPPAIPVSLSSTPLPASGGELFLSPCDQQHLSLLGF